MRPILLFTLSLLIFIGCTRTETSQVSVKSRKTVLIDVAHGGKDSGAVSEEGIEEKNLSLEYALYMKKELDKKRLNVILSRTDDRFMTLSDRVQIAENKNADLMISIHFNFSKVPETNGFETYYKPGCTKSMDLAELLHSKISESDLIGDRIKKHPGFYILKNSPVPAILINAGYLSDEKDVKLITNEGFKLKFANILAQAVDEYFRLSRNKF